MREKLQIAGGGKNRRKELGSPHGEPVKQFELAHICGVFYGLKT